MHSDIVALLHEDLMGALDQGIMHLFLLLVRHHHLHPRIELIPPSAKTLSLAPACHLPPAAHIM